LAVVVVQKKCGYMDRSGRIVIPPQFTSARDFSEGLAAVEKGEHWCYINSKGDVVISGPFNQAKDFHGGLARVHEGGTYEVTHDGPAYWIDGAWYYVNQRGEKVRRYCRDNDAPVYDP
jgi:hypothetical protein